MPRQRSLYCRYIAVSKRVYYYNIRLLVGAGPGGPCNMRPSRADTRAIPHYVCINLVTAGSFRICTW